MDRPSNRPSLATIADRRRFLGAAVACAAAPLAGVRAASPARGPAAGDEGEDEDLGSIGRTAHTRFAVNVEMWWRGLPFLERLDRAAELGFPAVEFWPWEDKDMDAIARRVRERGIEVSQFTAWGFRPGLNDPRNHSLFVEKVEAGCQVAEKLGCRLMTVVGGDDQPGMTQEEMHQNIIRGLARAAPIAEKHDVTLILEPMNIRVDHKGHSLYGSPPAIRICEAVGSSHVKINWDLYHMQITEGDLCGRLREGWKHVGYLQLADHPGRNEPGTGEVCYNRVLREAYELGYRGYVGLECRPLAGEVPAARRVRAADVW